MQQQQKEYNSEQHQQKYGVQIKIVIVLHGSALVSLVWNTVPNSGQAIQKDTDKPEDAQCRVFKRVKYLKTISSKEQ